ncbi:hypothetical protein [Nocardia sp. alder85J]|uniref:hypothetical protein n=1 Tax=Nocardia sp. alder85J TaxID=2862949 RepID=UPI001CD4E560|nr:hypothetical protein [Nocardia sp. alder85J]MCX4099126.1 hypothetical protein [Nocardia sp. alder85J]
MSDNRRPTGTPDHVRAAIAETVGLLPYPLTRDSAARYFDRCVSFCLDAAATAADLAARLLAEDPDAARQVADEARDFLAEARRIDAMRTKPVLSQPLH